MNSHTKPTQEQLEAETEQILKDLADESPEEKESAAEDQTEDKKADVEQEELGEEKKQEQEKEQEKEGESEEKPEKKEEKKADDTGQDGDVDFRKKFTESTRENQIIHAKNKKMTEAFEKANDLPEPTEEELKKEYPDWDEMSDFYKKIAKSELHNSRRLSALSEVAKEFKDLDAWKEKIETFISDPETFTKNPALEGKETEFQIFATKPSRRGIDFDDLVSAFLYEVESKPVVKKKGQMFPTGNAGQKSAPKAKSDRLSYEQGEDLRKTNFEQYKKYLTAGKIDSGLE